MSVYFNNICEDMQRRKLVTHIIINDKPVENVEGFTHPGAVFMENSDDSKETWQRIRNPESGTITLTLTNIWETEVSPLKIRRGYSACLFS